MINPLLQFDAPRRFVNATANGGAELMSTSRVLLGPGIIASISPTSPAPGEALTMTLDTTGPTADNLAALVARIEALEAQLATVDVLPNPNTIAKRNASGDLGANELRALALRANAENVSAKVSDNRGIAGVEVVYDGAVQRIGFFGVTPQARPVLTTGSGATVDDVIGVLCDLGIVEC